MERNVMNELHSDSVGISSPLRADEWLERTIEAISRAAGYVGLFVIVFAIAVGVRMAISE